MNVNRNLKEGILLTFVFIKTVFTERKNGGQLCEKLFLSGKGELLCAVDIEAGAV